MSMIAEDYEQEFSMYKYQGLLINPDGFRELENHMNPRKKIEDMKKAQPFESGIEADNNMKKPERFKKKDDGIELG